MNLQELLKQYAEKREKFDEIKTTATMEEVRSIHQELKELKERIELVREDRELDLPEPRSMEIDMTQGSKDESNEVRNLSPEQVDKEYEGVFLRAFRQQKLSKRDLEVYERMVELRDVPNATPYFLSEKGEDGGFIVPHSVSTMIQEYKRQGHFDLTLLVDVQMTAVLSGEFTYEKLGDITPWDNISQWETIPEVGTPQFERKEYKIEDYAGILPIPRTLLQDTDQNLLRHIAKYIARKTIVTRNAKILEVINENFAETKALENVDDFKDVFDLSLDPAFLGTTKIVTNQYGYNFLRKLKDEQGNYLMQPDVTQRDKWTIDGKEIVLVSSNTLPNVEGGAPIYIGDFKEAIRFFDRGVYEITPTTIGGHAFLRNSYDIRVIDRFTAIPVDTEAVVACTVPVTEQLPSQARS